MSIESVMTDLADSIRAKTGQTGALSLTAMKTAVDSLSSGFTICEDDFSYFLQGGEEKIKILDNIDFSRCVNSSYFLNNAKLDKDKSPLKSVDLRPLNIDGCKIDNANYMLNAMTNCTELILPESEWNCRATNYMFGGFAGTKIENLDKLGNDTGSKSTNDHRNMFRASKILEADLSGFKGRVVSLNMVQNMFYQCPTRKIWIPSTWTNISVNSQGYSMVNGISNADCIIFTDAPSMPSTWTGLWYYRTASAPVTIAWGSTHEEYEAY